MGWRGEECKDQRQLNYQLQRHPDQVGNDRKREVRAGFRPRTPRGGFCGVSAPRAEVLLFRQKDPKPWAPGRGPSGAFAAVPKGLGCGTRFAQTVLASN